MQQNQIQDTLQLRRVAIDTYKENVAYLNGDCEIYRVEGFQALSKIKVNINGKSILAVLNVVHDDTIVAPGELGLSEQPFEQLGEEEGVLVRVDHAEIPHSIDAVRRKIAGERLSAKDYQAITRDISEHRYSKTEMAAFLVAAGETGLDRDEILYYTRAMADSGERLNWREPLVVDKHCIGGIPGNRTTMLLVPIVAAHGMLIPKTSSRAITSPAGTSDTMEVLAEVNLSPQKLHAVVRKERGCLAWGGTAKLAPVDDILITVERPLGIESMGQMVASILSKKLAAGVTHLIIDIPVGPTAKMRHMRQALQLRKLFEFVGDRIGIQLEVVITDGRQPVGRGVGPRLEVRDVMQVLKNDPDAPVDLRQKGLRLAGRVLEFDPDVRGGHGYSIARDILDSGRALTKMQAIINAQGARKDPVPPAPLVHEINCNQDGIIIGIDNLQINRIARLAGAPMDKGAGIDLLKKLGDTVTVNEPLYAIHAEFRADYNFALNLARKDSGYSIGSVEELPATYVEF